MKQPDFIDEQIAATKELKPKYAVFCPFHYQGEYGVSFERDFSRILNSLADLYEPVTMGGAGGAGSGDLPSINAICLILKRKS